MSSICLFDKAKAYQIRAHRFFGKTHLCPLEEDHSLQDQHSI